MNLEIEQYEGELRELREENASLKAQVRLLEADNKNLWNAYEAKGNPVLEN